MASLENRYAKALLGLSEEKDSVEKDIAEASVVRDTLDKAEVQALLTHPHIPKEEKYDLFYNNFSNKIGDHFMGFLHLTVHKNRAELITPVLTEYIDQAKKRLGKTEAKVVSVKPLSQEQIERIRAFISKQLNIQVEIKTIIDPDFLHWTGLLGSLPIYPTRVNKWLNTMDITQTNPGE